MKRETWTRNKNKTTQLSSSSILLLLLFLLSVWWILLLCKGTERSNFCLEKKCCSSRAKKTWRQNNRKKAFSSIYTHTHNTYKYIMMHGAATTSNSSSFIHGVRIASSARGTNFALRSVLFFYCLRARTNLRVFRRRAMMIYWKWGKRE